MRLAGCMDPTCACGCTSTLAPECPTKPDCCGGMSGGTWLPWLPTITMPAPAGCACVVAAWRARKDMTNSTLLPRCQACPTPSRGTGAPARERKVKVEHNSAPCSGRLNWISMMRCTWASKVAWHSGCSTVARGWLNSSVGVNPSRSCTAGDTKTMMPAEGVGAQHRVQGARGDARRGQGRAPDQLHLPRRRSNAAFAAGGAAHLPCQRQRSCHADAAKAPNA